MNQITTLSSTHEGTNYRTEQSRLTFSKVTACALAALSFVAAISTDHPLERVLWVLIGCTLLSVCFIRQKHSQVDEKIQFCIKNGNAYLLLEGLQLKKVPVSVLDCKQLNILNLENNHLSSLPNMGSLTQLETLILSKNQFTSFPNEICNLTHLKKLVFNTNPMNQFPKNFNWPVQLETLEIAGIGCGEVPNIRKTFLNLRMLNLSDNDLTSIPKLPHSLECLYLNGNTIEDFSEKACYLERLKRLGLKNVGITTNALETLCGFTQLESLDISHNRLFFLPESLTQLKNLTMLDASDNYIETLDAINFSIFSKLASLNLQNNCISSLLNEENEKSIFNLPFFCLLSLENNHFTQSVTRRMQLLCNQSEYQGPRLSNSLFQSEAEDCRSLDELCEQLSKITNREQLQLKFFKSDAKLRDLLARLVDVSDYQTANRRALSEMIYDAIRKAEEDETFRLAFLLTIEKATETCGDRIAYFLLYMGIQLNIEKNKADLKQLFHFLGYGTWALSILERFAWQKVKALKFVDEIEVYLAYPVKVKERITNLAFDITSMKYIDCSGITEEDISSASCAILQFLSDREAYAKFLLENEVWLQALEKSEDMEIKLSFQGIKKERERAWKRFETQDFAKMEETVEERFKKDLLGLTQRLIEPFFNECQNLVVNKNNI